MIELETVAAVNFSPSLALYCIFFNIIFLQFLVFGIDIRVEMVTQPLDQLYFELCLFYAYLGPFCNSD